MMRIFLIFIIGAGFALYFINSIPQELNIEDRKYVCRAAISMLMGRQIEIISASTLQDETTLTTYHRPSDGKVWQNACRIDGDTVVWAAILEDGSTGRWRNHTLDETLTFKLEESGVTINMMYPDGESTEKSYTRQ